MYEENVSEPKLNATDPILIPTLNRAIILPD